MGTGQWCAWDRWRDGKAPRIVWRWPVRAAERRLFPATAIFGLPGERGAADRDTAPDTGRPARWVVWPGGTGTGTGNGSGTNLGSGLGSGVGNGPSGPAFVPGSGYIGLPGQRCANGSGNGTSYETGGGPGGIPGGRWRRSAGTGGQGAAISAYPAAVDRAVPDMEPASPAAVQMVERESELASGPALGRPELPEGRLVMAAELPALESTELALGQVPESRAAPSAETVPRAMAAALQRMAR